MVLVAVEPAAYVEGGRRPRCVAPGRLLPLPLRAQASMMILRMKTWAAGERGCRDAWEAPTPQGGQCHRALEKGRRAWDVLLPARHHMPPSANHGDASILLLTPTPLPPPLLHRFFCANLCENCVAIFVSIHLR